jgi:hypothetical protein
MADRYYSSVARPTELTVGVDSSAGSIQVAATTGFPQNTPYILVLDPDTEAEEIVEVAQVSGLALTVTRGVDGTVARNHSAGAKVRHQAIGNDLQRSRDHEAATNGVHGLDITDTVAGVGATQTLENKTIDGTDNTLLNIPQAAIIDLEADILGLVEDIDTVDGDLTAHEAATEAHGASGAVVGTTNTQTLENKTIDGGSNTLANIPASAVTGLAAVLTSVDRIACGFLSMEFDNDGVFVFQHNLGWTPTVMLFTPHLPGGLLSSVIVVPTSSPTPWNSTQATVVAKQTPSGEPYTGGLSRVSWIAIRATS